MKQRKVSKILPRARPAAEPLVLSIDLMESMRRAQASTAAPGGSNGAAVAQSPLVQDAPPPQSAADGSVPPPPAPESVRAAEFSAPPAPAQVPPDIDLMRQQAQRLLADTQTQTVRLQQEAQTRMMDAQKALLDAQAQAQTLVADAQAQAHRILGDAELQLKRVQLEVDAQIRVQKEQRLREMEGELAALRQGAQQEGREAGRREGFEVGRSEAVASVNVAAGEIVGKLREILEMTQQIKGQELEKIEGELVELSLEIAQKVTHAELKTNPDVVLAIARDCIRKVSERAGIVLKVNRDDLDYVLSRKEEFSALEDLEKLHIHEDARVTRGGVIMETNQGEIDGRLEVQMDKIRDSFHALLEEDSA